VFDAPVEIVFEIVAVTVTVAAPVPAPVCEAGAATDPAGDCDTPLTSGVVG